MRPCAIAGFFVFVAFLWTMPLQHVIAYPFVFLFFGAVMGSAWFGGIIAGFVAVALSSVIVTYFFVPPLFSMSRGKGITELLRRIHFVLHCHHRREFVRGSEPRMQFGLPAISLKPRCRSEPQSCSDPTSRSRRANANCAYLPKPFLSRYGALTLRVALNTATTHLCDYLGQRTEELKGEAFFNVIHPEDKPLFRQGWQAALKSGDRFEIEARVRGCGRWLSLVSGTKHSAAFGRRPRSRAGTVSTSTLSSSTGPSKILSRRRTISRACSVH